MKFIVTESKFDSKAETRSSETAMEIAEMFIRKHAYEDNIYQFSVTVTVDDEKEEKKEG